MLADPRDADRRPSSSKWRTEENKMNEKFGRGGDRGNISQRPVAYVISAVEGFVDEVTVRRYSENYRPGN
jgi:hypothetical protein